MGKFRFEIERPESARTEREVFRGDAGRNREV